MSSFKKKLALAKCRYLVVKANQRFVEMSRIETYAETAVFLGDVESELNHSVGSLKQCITSTI